LVVAFPSALLSRQTEVLDSMALANLVFILAQAEMAFSPAVVLDNEAWGSEIAYQRVCFNGRYIGAHCLSPRYNEVAKLCGGIGYYVTEKGELADAIREATRADKPVVIHAKVTVDMCSAFASTR